jgi:hypothetical protein
MAKHTIPNKIIENSATNALLLILIISSEEHRKTTATTHANAMATCANWQDSVINDIIMEDPPNMYAESNAKFSNLAKISPSLADILQSKNNPTSFKLKSALDLMLSSQRAMADTYVTQQKKIINSRLQIIPKFAKTIGRESIPVPIAVPASKDIALNCLRIRVTSKNF